MLSASKKYDIQQTPQTAGISISIGIIYLISIEESQARTTVNTYVYPSDLEKIARQSQQLEMGYIQISHEIAKRQVNQR